MSDPKPLAVKNSQGVTFYLHSKIVHLRGGKPVPIFFFIKGGQVELAQRNNAIPEPEVPPRLAIHENPRNHMLTLRRKAEGDLAIK